jgi:hypothetical protein
VTTSIFRFKEGAVGTLTHTVLLHQAAYHTAFEIMADGLHILVEDPYDQASLTVRRPRSGTYEKVRPCLGHMDSRYRLWLRRGGGRGSQFWYA